MKDKTTAYLSHKKNTLFVFFSGFCPSHEQGSVDFGSHNKSPELHEQ